MQFSDLSDLHHKRIRKLGVKGKVLDVLKLDINDSDKQKMIDQIIRDSMDSKNRYMAEIYNNSEVYRDEKISYSKDYMKRPDVRPIQLERKRKKCRKIRDQNKALAESLRQSRCEVSGSKEDLQWAHKASGTKEYNITRFYTYVSMINDPRFQREMQKCVLLSGEVHRAYDICWYRLFGYEQTNESYHVFRNHYQGYLRSGKQINYFIYLDQNPPKGVKRIPPPGSEE